MEKSFENETAEFISQFDEFQNTVLPAINIDRKVQDQIKRKLNHNPNENNFRTISHESKENTQRSINYEEWKCSKQLRNFLKKNLKRAIIDRERLTNRSITELKPNILINQLSVNKSVDATIPCSPHQSNKKRNLRIQLFQERSSSVNDQNKIGMQVHTNSRNSLEEKSKSYAPSKLAFGKIQNSITSRLRSHDKSAFDVLRSRIDNILSSSKDIN